MKNLQRPVESDNQISIEMEVTATAPDIENSAARFQEVSVVGYTTEREIVCQHQIGGVAIGESSDVTLRCATRPEYLTLSISEAGCEYNTVISVARVNEPGSESPYTALDDKHCDDPELPVPDE